MQDQANKNEEHAVRNNLEVIQRPANMPLQQGMENAQVLHMPTPKKEIETRPKITRAPQPQPPAQPRQDQGQIKKIPQFEAAEVKPKPTPGGYVAKQRIVHFDLKVSVILSIFLLL